MDETGHSMVVRDLSKRFGKFQAVDRVSFEVKAGEIFGFLGANGAGKSTTIRMLCGLLRPSAGSAQVAGYDVIRSPEKVKANIGYMSQKFSLYGDLTVDENLAFFGGVYGLKGERLERRRRELLDELQLGSSAGELAGQLPRGFQQRLAFACAILHEPGVIFLDEPTAGVDPLQRRAFWNRIYDFSARGVTVFVTTHFLDEAEFCHRIALIAAGRIAALDTPSGLKRLLSGFDIFEIECDPVVRGLEIIQSSAWAAGVSIFGSAVHASVARGGRSAEEIRIDLEAAGVRVSRIDPIDPSLEDVFLYLAQEQGA